MNSFFRPYEGREPYIFISYAHRDSDSVLPAITPLHEKCYRVWYDEGIPAGSDWPKNIAEHMRACSATLFFLSAHSISSPNCFNEIEAAFRQQKPILCLRLDDTPLPARWAELLQGAAPVAFTEDAPSVSDNILTTGVIDESFLGDGKTGYGGVKAASGVNGWTVLIIVGVLLLLATGVGAYGLSNGWFSAWLPAQDPAAYAPAYTEAPTPMPTPMPTLDPNDPGIGIMLQPVSFPDELQARAIRAALGKNLEEDVYTNELFSVSELYLIGNMYLQNDAGVTYSDDGRCLVNGVAVAEGSVSDLSLLSDMLALTRLSLVKQPIRSIAPLDALTYLTELSAAGCPLDTLPSLSHMPSLSTLHLEHTAIRDLTPLSVCPALRTVTVSADMFPLTLDPQARYDVVLVY